MAPGAMCFSPHSERESALPALHAQQQRFHCQRDRDVLAERPSISITSPSAHATEGRRHFRDEATADALRRQDQARGPVPAGRPTRDRGDGEAHRGSGRDVRHSRLARGCGLPAVPLPDLGRRAPCSTGSTAAALLTGRCRGPTTGRSSASGPAHRRRRGWGCRPLPVRMTKRPQHSKVSETHSRLCRTWTDGLLNSTSRSSMVTSPLELST